MHSALFVAVEPTSLAPSQVWLSFVSDANKHLEINKHVDKLARNVWLVNFHSSPAALASLISGAEARGVAYKILALADVPQWLPDNTSTDHSL
jgi:hypothetical protein